MLRVFIEVLDPFEAYVVVSPSVIAHSDSLSYWNASLVPGHLMKLAVEDDKWRDRLSFSVDCLDYGNPCPVTRLFCS